MQGGRRSAGPRGQGRSGAAHIAAQLAVPVALGLVIGLVLAFQAGSSNSGVDPLPLGAAVSPSLLAGPPASLATSPGTRCGAVSLRTQRRRRSRSRASSA